MAREHSIPDINRRQLVVAAAAATASAVAPALPVIDADVMPDAAQAVLSAPDVPGLTISTGMARRFLAIEHRQQIRREAGLPLLSIIKELKKLKRLEREEQFAKFAAANGDAVLDGILKRRREEEGDPNWRPRWAEGVAIGNRVRGILLQRFRAARRLGSTFSQDQPDLAISFYDATGDSRTAAT